MKLLLKAFKFRLKLVVIGLLTILLITACQGDSDQQFVNSAPSSDCRKIQHALGETCVPRESKRLISLDETTLADAIAVGVPSIGVAVPDGTSIDYLAEKMNQLAAVEILGKSEQPNLETMLKLKPDLIVGLDFWGESIFPQLSQIAPTALGEWKGFPSWREYFDFVANTLGKQEKAQLVWQNYNQRVEEIRTALGNRLQNIKVSSVYAYNDTINVNATNGFDGSIFSDIGIQRPKIHAAVEYGVTNLSEEAIPEIDADVLFVSVYNAESEQTVANWEKKPLWKQLKVVQNKRVYIVDANVWAGGSPIAANLEIDDLFKYLVDVNENI